MPDIDPATGNEKTQDPGVETFQVKKEEWDALQQKLDSFEQRGAGGQFAPQPPMPTAPPPPPAYKEEVAQISTRIETLDSQIDQAVQEGQPFSKLLRERDSLNAKIQRLTFKHEELDPALSVGINVIDQLSGEVTKSRMPYYDTVRADIDQALQSLPPEQRMNPQVREAAYKMAVGQNIDKIMQVKQQEWLRESASDPSLTPGGQSGRNSQSNEPQAPDPNSILGSEAIKALRFRGLSVDSYYQKQGYSGWADFWEKTGKDYFGEEAM